jgi:hypothetical protein
VPHRSAEVTRGWRAWIVLIALAGACDRPPDDGRDADGGAPLRSGALALVRTARWPGGGRELTVRVGGEEDEVGTRDLSGAIRLSPDREVVVRQVALAPGYTAVLVRPDAEAAARDVQAEALRAFIALRPAVEQIALFRWGATVEQVVGFTANRARLDRDLERALVPDAESPTEPISAQLAVADEVQKVGNSGLRVMRAVVVAGGDPSPQARELTAMPIVSLAAATGRIDQLAAEAHYAVAVCGDAELPPATLSADGVDGALAIEWPDAWPESLDQACDAERIGVDPQPVPEVVQLLFTGEQRSVYDARVEAVSKAEFDLSVKLAPDQDAIAATAHFRGKGTLACQRKSYTVTLDGPGRHLFPDIYADEVYLIAMCGDERYIQLHTANQLMAARGVFPVRFRYVELLLDDETRGVYLMVEKIDDALEDGTSRVSAVMRRRFDPPEDRMEVEKTGGSADAAIAAWEEFLSGLGDLEGDELEAAAAERLDLDRYLDWLALMTSLGNGDYVDEVWMTASDALGDDGAVRPHWAVTGWDCDDLFDTCHYAGSYAFVDPNELFYCSEGRIDQVLLGDPVLYARAVDELETLLEEVTPDVLQAALDATAAGLLPYFERADICAAMGELLDDNPGAIDPEEAQRDIREHLELLHDSYAARRATLLDRIAAYRAAQ